MESKHYFCFMPEATSLPASASINPPKQSRSRKTLERIVKASLEILGREGPEGLTVHAVVERAGSSVGSFYARFKGKDDLLDYLGERVWTEARDRWAEKLAERNWSEVPLPELIDAAVVLLIDAQQSRTVYLEAIDRAAGEGDAYASFRDLVVKGLAELLLAHGSQLRHERPELAVRLALEAVLGIVDAEGGRDDEPPREVLLGECRSLVSAYLTGEGADRDGESVDFFDVWG
jgi:AcrR family transcriptional regulator